MDQNLSFARTEKGRVELLEGGRTLKPRQRQVLFLVSEAVSVQQLKQKLPTCQELEPIIEQLWEGGYIGQVKSGQAPAPQPAVPAKPASQTVAGATGDIAVAKARALEIINSLVGDRSPVYKKVNGANTPEEFIAAVSWGKKVIAAVASASHAQNFESEILSLINA